MIDPTIATQADLDEYATYDDQYEPLCTCSNIIDPDCEVH